MGRSLINEKLASDTLDVAACLNSRGRPAFEPDRTAFVHQARYRTSVLSGVAQDF